MAENRREKDRRYYFTRGQMVLLGAAFTLASVIIFALGMFVGKEIEARKMVRPEEPLVKVPVKPPQSAGEPEGAKGKDDLTFYNTLTKTPAQQAAEKAEGKEAEKIAKPAVKEKKAEERETAPARAKASESRAEKAPAAAESETNGKGWSVQANSYPDAKSASDLVDRLKNKGYNAFVTEANVKGKVWYRVRVGRFASREEAEKTVAALKSNEDLGKAFATRK
jgi:cell division septation protein DedD